MIVAAVVIFCAIFYSAFLTNIFWGTYKVLGSVGQSLTGSTSTVDATSSSLSALTPIDAAAYNAKLLAIANVPPRTITIVVTSTIPGTTTIQVSKINKDRAGRERVAGQNRAIARRRRTAPFQPHRRVLRQLLFHADGRARRNIRPDQMMAMLASTTAEWRAADPSTPVIPALDYIVVTAQGSAGADGKYRLRMPDSQVEKAIALMAPVNGLVFLDFQVGQSNVETEVPQYASYLKLPNVELSLDPEFDMEPGVKPDQEIGTMDASDINWAANYLANIVTQNNLPPKILVVHRFTEDMVTNYQKITPLPQVQVVIDMDGWGSQAKKINTYERVEAAEPVQFTGFKLFYKNDLLPPSTGMLTPQQVLQLSPQPSYIQYQ